MVATFRNLAPSNGSDATFRAWGSGVSSALTEVGWPKTADTGQIDWATVLYSTTANTDAGYEIRSNGSNIFLKVLYGSGNPASYPRIGFQVGTGSNGAGGLTGQIYTGIYLTANVSTGTQYRCNFAGTADYLAVALFIGISSYFGGFCLERGRAANGSVVTDHLLISHFLQASTIRNQVLPLSGSIPAAQISGGVFMPTDIASGSFGADVVTYPNFLFNVGQIMNPGITSLGYFSGDIAEGSQAQVSMYGTPRNYYFLGTGAANPSRGTLSGASLAMIYE